MKRHDDPAVPTASDARALFDRASERLDLATANRLRLMRRDALATHAPRRWLPAGTAFAAIALVAVVWWRPGVAPHAGPSPQSPTAASSSLEVGGVSDEDAELYAWLGDAPVAPEDKAGTP